MANIIKKPDTLEKLKILSQDSQYDLACSCGTKDSDHRTRTEDNRWLYPVALPDGRNATILKTLVSNSCINDCQYCPLRVDNDTQRCRCAPEELVKIFLAYYRAHKVFGLFLSSGVTGSPDQAMERINAIAEILRQREQFKGYLHLKIIPGASDAAIEKSLTFASGVSLNIETAGEHHFNQLSTTKNYITDIIRPIKLISKFTQRGGKYHQVKQTTQFVVGASEETDRELVTYCNGLYTKLGLNRIYFSAYQRGLGTANLPGEHSEKSNSDLLTREHRLYQVDWLLRKYFFSAHELPFDHQGYLSLTTDPKQMWAQNHPEFYPVDINRASKKELLRVPGLGPVMVKKIIAYRQLHRIRSLRDIGKNSKLLEKTAKYVKFGW